MTRGRIAELGTPRCVLRPVAAADAEALHTLWTSPGVRRFLWDDEIISREQTQAAIGQSGRMFEERSLGLWGARLSASADLIGFGGIWPFRDPPDLELLFGVSEHLWGQGYAAEIARAVIDYCFGSLAMPVIRASTDTGNRASARVLEKLGSYVVDRRTVGGLDALFYELAREADRQP